jgi:hypothetical protein
MYLKKSKKMKVRTVDEVKMMMKLSNKTED